MPIKFNSRIESEFYHRFNNLNLKFKISNGKEYLIKAIHPNKRFVPYDFSINIGNHIVALIELKNRLSFETYDISRLEKFASENNIRYIVLSDSERFIVTDRRNQNEKTVLKFDEFCAILQEKEEINVELLKQQIADVIKSIILGKEFVFLKEHIQSFNQQLSEEIEYDELAQCFSFRNPSDINNLENQIFRYLLKDGDPIKKIYRYTTLSTIFSMLYYNSFRMNCLVGMNDTTEVNYAENYVFGTNRDFALAPWQTVDAYNRRFIASCSLKKDDLTQWRLYAEDTKGVCLVFNILENEGNGKFIIKRISYGEEDGSHKVLDLIKEIISTLKSALNCEFEFKTLNTWRHFFKPFDYKVEEEVRILYIQQLSDVDIKKGWLLTNSHNILNPFVEFKLNDEPLPVDLTEIVLGPKCPEKEINKPQFEQLIRELKSRKKKLIVKNEEKEMDEYNLDGVTISISKIRNYR